MACERWRKVEKAAGTKMSEKRMGALPLFFFCLVGQSCGVSDFPFQAEVNELNACLLSVCVCVCACAYLFISASTCL